MKVYGVCELWGGIGPETLVGVFSTREKAEKFGEKCGEECPEYLYVIEEWEVDKEG